jgi:serine/threonine-protein kinase
MSSLDKGSVIAGKYRLERVLAQGGMGSVWIARHLQLDVGVAVKLMAPALAASADGRARFEREAKASALLKSPHVVLVHDYGVEGETPYLVMELLEGEDLEARLDREGRLTPAATLSIVRQMCKALHDLHGIGLVHRDLKPANVFLARYGSEDLVKILDFGIAKATGPLLGGNVTKTGTLLGSPSYMSPEQVRRSKDVDARSDLWSIGVIVFQCLTGRLPFAGEELGELFIEICTEPIPVASQIAPELGLDIDRFLARALTREPSARFQSADELASALAAAVESGGKRPQGFTSATADTVAAAPLAFYVPASAPLGSDAPAQKASVNTLGPSGHTITPAPSHARRTGVVLALLGGALALAVATFTALRTPAPEGAAAPPAAAVAATVAAEPVPPVAPPGSPASDLPKSSPSGSASPTAVQAPDPSASAPARSEQPRPLPLKRAPQPKALKPSKEDPRDHM